MLKGNLAPDGSVVKRSAVVEEMMVHEGPARVFECEEDAIAAIKGGRIVAGDVVVIRYEGPKGGPGMREIALVEESDIISIDIPHMKLDMKVSEEELAARRAKWQPREPEVTTGYLARYREMVTSGNRGAILEIAGHKGRNV